MMNKLNRILTASPSEFAAIFGELVSDTATETDSTGAPQGAVVAATLGPARKAGPGDAHKSREVEFFSLEASIGTLASRHGDAF